MQVGEGRAAGHARERVARVLERLEHLPIAALDPGAVRGEDPAIIGMAAEALDDSFRVPGVDVHGWGEVARVAFEVEQGAGEVEGYLD